MYPESFCQAAYVNSLREFISHRHISKKLKKFIRAIMSIDLAAVDELLAETYSKFGPRPYAPSGLLISCLLAAYLKVPSITDWVERLRDNVLYARICGWRDCRNVPAVGTFYNFATRLWALDSPNIPRLRMKFRCPKLQHCKGQGGKKVICNCDQKCTDSDYGPVVHLPMRENPRMFCQPTRGSKEWVKEYKRRSSAERDNKRIKTDYKLEDGHHRSSKLWYCRLYVILMLEHLVAWQHTASLQAPLADEAIAA